MLLCGIMTPQSSLCWIARGHDFSLCIIAIGRDSALWNIPRSQNCIAQSAKAKCIHKVNTIVHFHNKMEAEMKGYLVIKFAMVCGRIFPQFWKGIRKYFIALNKSLGTVEWYPNFLVFNNEKIFRKICVLETVKN
jgi:hypothetical protein